MSPWAHSDRRSLRIGLTLLTLADASVLGSFLARAEAGSRMNPAAPHLLLSLAAPAPAIFLTLLCYLAAVPFALRGNLKAGALLLASMALMHEAFAAHEGPGRGFFATGVTLLGWLIGSLLQQTRGVAGGQRTNALAETGAASCFGATYVAAVTSKLTHAGLDWGGDVLRQQVLQHHDVESDGFTGVMARWVVETHGVADVLGVLTLLIQGAAILWVLLPARRAWLGAVILGFHVNVLLLLRILYPGAMGCFLLLSFPWPRIWRRLRGQQPALATPAEEQTLGEGAWRRVLVACAAVMLLAWLIPIRNYTRLHGLGPPAGHDHR